PVYGGQRPGKTPGLITVSFSGSSPTIVALPVEVGLPTTFCSDHDFKPFTTPSVKGEYKLPSAAQDGYQVSASVYSACRPVKRNPLSVAEDGNGQSFGGSEGQIS